MATATHVELADPVVAEGGEGGTPLFSGLHLHHDTSDVPHTGAPTTTTAAADANSAPGLSFPFLHSAHAATSAAPPPTSAPSPLQSQFATDLYAAQTFPDGMRVVFRHVPYWVPVAGLLSAVGLYCVTFQVRLFVSKWRIAQRRLVERKYDLLDDLRVGPMSTVGHLETLGDDDVDDDDDDEYNDETAVSNADIEEFRSSLGIRLPRDEDLLEIVERMLLVDPIPSGWVLYRTTTGVIRYMNLNTKELAFFPPAKHKEEQKIESEIKKRNRQAMESKYNFSYEDEGLNAQSLQSSYAARTGGAGGLGAGGGPGPAPVDFGDDDFNNDEDFTQNSTFKRVFKYFVEREQKRIEEDVARSRVTAERGSSGTSAAEGGPHPSGVGGAAGNAAGAASTTTHRRVVAGASVPNRVVSSSGIRPSGRGGL